MLQKIDKFYGFKGVHMNKCSTIQKREMQLQCAFGVVFFFSLTSFGGKGDTGAEARSGREPFCRGVYCFFI